MSLNHTLIYLVSILLRNAYDFLDHWYIKSFTKTSHYMLGVFEELDKIFALKLTLRNLFQPLYQDRTLIGYIIGFAFRSLIIIVSSIIYLFVFIVSVALYLIWLALPIVLIYKAIISNAGQ